MTGVLQRIADIAGDHAARLMAAEYGGRRIYLPANLPADHALSKLLGFEAACQIRNAFGAGHLEVPMGTPPTRDYVRIQVDALTKAGKSANEIARTLHITSRTVRRHRAALRR